MQVNFVVINLGGPYFNKLPQNIVIHVGEVLPFTLPQIHDPDLEDIGSIFSIDFGQAKSFVQGRRNQFMLTPTNP